MNDWMSERCGEGVTSDTKFNRLKSEVYCSLRI